MTILLSFFPLELLTSISQYLQLDDIKSTRLACKSLNEGASPFLIERVWISSSPQDQDILTAISTHGVFSKHVTEIIYDATIYEERLLSSISRDGSSPARRHRFRQRYKSLQPCVSERLNRIPMINIYLLQAPPQKHLRRRLARPLNDLPQPLLSKSLASNDGTIGFAHNSPLLAPIHNIRPR